jgi:hypothetical protein
VYSASEPRADERFVDMQKGPLMILSYGMPALGRVAGAVSVPLPEPSRLPDVTAHFGEPAPPVSIGQAEYLGVLASLAPILGVGSAQDEGAWRRFAWIRSGYDDALRALAGLTQAAPAPWTTDRAADVGKPRFLRRRPLRVDWSANLPAGMEVGSQVAATGG